MPIRNLVIIASIAIISSLLTYLLTGQDPRKSAPAEPPKQEISTSNETIDVYPPGIDDKAVHSNTSENAPGATIASSPDRTRPQRESGSDQAKRLRLQKQNELKEKFASLLDKSSPDSGLSAKIENRFYLEEWDQEWASSKENNILQLFETNPTLFDIFPLHVACRSKNCQIVLAASSQDEVRLLSEKLMQVAKDNDIGMQDKFISFFPDTSNGRLVFYLSENGNMELFQ